MHVSRVKLGGLFEESEARVRVDHVLDEGHKVFGHEEGAPVTVAAHGDAIAAAADAAVVVVGAVGCRRVGVDHGEQAHEARRLVVVVRYHPVKARRAS